MCFSFPKMPDKLTSTEQTILDYIAKHRDGFLCMSIGQLSSELDISEATVSRFARHVGCSDFKQLKRIVAEQTVEKGPAQKISNTLRTGNGNILQYWEEQQHYNLNKTFELLDKDEFDKAVQALKKANRVFIFAKNASRSPAQLLEFRLRRIGVDVRRISGSGTELLEELPSVNADDVVVIFGFSKISFEANVIFDCQKRIGYTTVLFTGKLYQPDEQKADINLFVYRGEENEYHSMSAPVAIVDLLVLALSAQLGSGAVENLEKDRKLKSKYSNRF